MNISGNLKINFFVLFVFFISSTYSFADNLVPIVMNGITIFVPVASTSSKSTDTPAPSKSTDDRPTPSKSTEPLRANKHTRLGDGRHMKSDVTLYRNGEIGITTRSWTNNVTRGLTEHSMFAVIIDNKGNAIWVTKSHPLNTVSGTGDIFGGHSSRVETNIEKSSSAIGKYAYSIDIYQSSGSQSGLRNNLINGIKETKQVIKELKDAINELD